MAVPEPEAVWPLSGTTQPSPPAVVGVADLRATNAAAVLAVVRSADAHPRLSGLVEATNLSRPTVEAITEELTDCGLIEVAPALSARGQRSPGRPARRFRFRPHAGFVVGVDVRTTSVTVCLADLDGRSVAVQRKAVHADLTGAARARAVTATVEAAMAHAEVDPARVWAATVGTPGLVDRTNARVRQADNLRTWADTDIAGILRDLLHCPVAVENDANLAALGEQWRGIGNASAVPTTTAGSIAADTAVIAGKGVSTAVGGDSIAVGGSDVAVDGAGESTEVETDGAGPNAAAEKSGVSFGEMVFVLLGERLGAGIITGGRLLRGHHGAAGEIGFIRFPGSSGSTGSPGLEPLPSPVVADAAKGQADAVAAVESYGRRLAEGIAPVLLALDPALVVLGTGRFPLPDTSPAADLLLNAARAHADTLLVDPPRWQLSALGDEAVLTGAVRFALSPVEDMLRTRPMSLVARAPHG
ncbi:ROK family protein [Streptomyces sp. NPDC087903]|uniref:ROK family protein n=1 Tax=Streptomyces sp. NPDC087903 TaxID=3365819 RepID=UPI0038210916